MKLFQVLIVAVFMLFENIFEVLADRPCDTRQIPDQSTVCVCNTSYCDEITRDVPSSGSYIAYTSSKVGLRFYKTQGKWSDEDISSCCPTILELDTKTTYQKVQGFGGAVTDATAINWRSLPPILQDSLIKSYFSEKGLEYNMLRVPIGGCDFSTHPYAYNELPINDTYLTNYTLALEDVKFKIPMIKSIMKVAKTPIHIVATTWSPPVWMKTENTYGGLNRLKPEYFQTYADYHLKFIQKYNESGIPIWGITTTNEPINGAFALSTFNSLGWDMIEMGKWIVENLGPTIRNSDFRDVKIITVDDQRITIPYWFNVMLSRHPNALQYIDGIGVHYYTDKFIPPAIFEIVTLTNPEKFILATEACEGSFPWQSEKVLPGSWDRAKSYILDILEDLNYNLVGWIDWNLCLNNKGGPNWVENYVDSAIIVDEKRNDFFKQPMFYAMGHFSKFIPRDSVRIKVTEKKSFLSSYLHQVAFITPRNTIVIIIYNNGHERTVILSNGNTQASVFLEADSVTTVLTHINISRGSFALSEGPSSYNDDDKGPFVVYVSKETSDPAAGTNIRAIKFGQILHNNKIPNIINDEVKNVVCNEIAVQFFPAEAANT